MESAVAPASRAHSARMKDTSQSDPLVHATRSPDIDNLVTEFTRCNPVSDGWNRINDADSVRFCRWPNQHIDGRKHDSPGSPAFPWNGASDTRPMTADAIINERVALLTTAFWRAITRPKMAGDEAAQYAVTLADHFVNEVLYDDLTREVELSAQYQEHYGWVVLHPTWEQRVALKKRSITLKEVLALADQVAAADPEAPKGFDLEQMILDPAMEDGAMERLRALYDLYAADQMAGALEAEVPSISDASLRRALRELRADAKTEVPVPYLCMNAPAVYALRPWDEVFLPSDTTDLQRGRVVFQREWVTEAELRARILEDGYDPKWVEAAVQHKGKMTRFIAPNVPAATFDPVGLVDTTAPQDHIEVVHATYRAVDNDNVPAIYCTTFHPQVKTSGATEKPLYAKHELIDYPHGQYPYIDGKREHWCRCVVASRGVPEIVRTWQNEVKTLRDATIDWTSLGVLPPVNTYKTPFDTKYKFGPAVQNLVMPGKEPQFMQIPANGVPVALEASQRIDAAIANYFGLSSELVSPERAQTIQARSVMNFLLMWSRALQQIVSLAQKYMADVEFARITGAPVGWLDANRDRMGVMAVALHFDVRELNEELTMKRLEVVNRAILPTDVQGVIQRNKWVQLQLRAVDPTWAKELVVDSAEASEQLFNQVKNDIAQMFLGNPPQMVENDPTAQAKLQFASQIVGSNPNYQQALQQGERFAELMQLYVKNLSFSVTQEKNKQVGRIGVDPMEAQQGMP